MKVSADRFSEILSSYFDGEASPEELNVLSQCVRGNAYFAGMFLDYCKIQMATCELYSGTYSKENLAELMNYAVATLSRRVDVSDEPFPQILKRFMLRWSLTVSLMALCAVFAFLAFKKNSDADPSSPELSMSSAAEFQCQLAANPFSDMRAGESGTYCASAIIAVSGAGLKVLLEK